MVPAILFCLSLARVALGADFLMIHIPKTSGSTFQHFYALGNTTALGRTMKACEKFLDSHWPRQASLADPRWVKFKKGECNFIPIHDTLYHAMEKIVAVKGMPPSIVFTSLRDPIERLISMYAYGCCTALASSCDGDGKQKKCEAWVPEAITKHGLMALVEKNKLCSPSECEWGPELLNLHQPNFGQIMTWTFQDYSDAKTGGKDELEKLNYLSGHSEESIHSAKVNIESLDVIMLTAYDEESVCLFYWTVGKKLIGKESDPFLKAFNEECRVDSTGFPNTGVFKDRSKNLSSHGNRIDNDLQQGLSRNLLNEISMYKHGVSIFCRQMQQMITQSGIGFPRINMLCNQY